MFFDQVMMSGPQSGQYLALYTTVYIEIVIVDKSFCIFCKLLSTLK